MTESCHFLFHKISIKKNKNNFLLHYFHNFQLCLILRSKTLKKKKQVFNNWDQINQAKKLYPPQQTKSLTLDHHWAHRGKLNKYQSTTATTWGDKW